MDEKIQIAQNMFSAAVVESYLSYVPVEVIEFFEQFPDYVHTTGSIKLYGSGFTWLHVSFDKAVPRHPDFDRMFDPGSDAAKLSKLYSAYLKLQQEKDKLKHSTKIALLNLGTTKKIIEKFPLAAPYLPKEKKMLPAVNLQPLIKQLEKIQ